MKMKSLFKHAFCLAATGFLMTAFSSCGNDNEPETPQPVDLQSVTTAQASYSLSEAGTVTIDFTAKPADADVSKVLLKQSPMESDPELLTVTSLKAGASKGAWRLEAKASDFSRIVASQTVHLMAYSKSGATHVTASATLADPYSIIDRYKLEHPFSAGYRDAVEKDRWISLPVFVTATGEADPADITDMEVQLHPSNSSVKAEDFIVKEMEDASGFTVQLNPTAESKLAAEERIMTGLIVTVTDKNGRTAMLGDVGFVLSPPVVTVAASAELTFSLADLRNQTFKKDFEVDYTEKLKHLGLTEKQSETFDFGGVTWQVNGLYDANGQLINDDPDFLIFSSLTYKGDIMVAGDPVLQLEPGTYYYVSHYSADWKHGGKAYPRIRGLLRLTVTLTEK